MRVFVLFLILLSATAVAEPIVEFDFLINQTGDVYVYNMRTLFGEPDEREVTNTEFKITLNDESGMVMTQMNVPASFVILDPFQPIAQVPASVQLPYTQAYKKLRIYRNDEWLYEHDVSILCNNDGRCQRSENFAGCPQDCPSGSTDGLCDRQADNKCDADCIAGDKDCKITENMTVFDVISLGGVIVLTILFAITLYFLMRSPVEQRKIWKSRIVLIIAAKIVIIVVPQILKRMW